MEFGDLQDDEVIKQKLNNLHNSIEKIDKMMEVLLNADIYDKLTTKEKVDYDLFLAYSINTLYWIYLQLNGEDPNNNDVKNQLNRVKEYMLKAKAAQEKEARPRVNKNAAGRFIKHGIQYRSNQTDKPPNKKIKLLD